MGVDLDLLERGFELPVNIRAYASLLDSNNPASYEFSVNQLGFKKELVTQQELQDELWRKVSRWYAELDERLRQDLPHIR